MVSKYHWKCVCAFVYLCVCVCNRPTVRGVCTKYEVVDYQPRTVTPLKPRLHWLLLHSYFWPSLPLLLKSNGIAGGTTTTCPDNPSTDVRLVSSQYHMTTRESPVSVSAYRYSCESPSPFTVSNPLHPYLTRPHHVFKIPVAAAPLMPSKSLLTWPYDVSPLLTVSTTAPGDTPLPSNPSPLRIPRR